MVLGEGCGGKGEGGSGRSGSAGITSKWPTTETQGESRGRKGSELGPGGPALAATDVQTIASYVALVGRSGVSEEIGPEYLYAITKALIDSKSQLVSEHPALASMNENLGTAPQFPLYEEAAQYYARNQPFDWSGPSFYISTILAMLSLLVALQGAYVQYRVRKSKKEKSPEATDSE